ncbi:uncharacterized protein DFL_009450 [Arthrobotrys flagrans]|uniref:3'-5' exonuclease domain-containing protein n=1 Tax=Arthrobotrys flagrans TaxID=97331 RepID=A0A436ZS13_ARTFL|nr:hypothetical protein DFL_009450 [Arthrobotrys flagrans]
MAPPESTFVDTPEAISTLLSLIPRDPNPLPSIYIDLEGVDLCRSGSISILQLFISTIPHIYIIDIHTLGNVAFTTPSSTDASVTLKSILEDPSIPVVFYDIRSDNDALYHHFNIHISNVIDLQLYELATRDGFANNRRYLHGLSKAILANANLSAWEAARMDQVKQRGLGLFAPEKGGSYEVFNRRPLPGELLEYCVQDVQYLPVLLRNFTQRLGRMDKRWMERIRTETEARIALCKRDSFPKGRQNALAPVSFRRI